MPALWKILRQDSIDTSGSIARPAELTTIFIICCRSKLNFPRVLRGCFSRMTNCQNLLALSYLARWKRATSKKRLCSPTITTTLAILMQLTSQASWPCIKSFARLRRNQILRHPERSPPSGALAEDPPLYIEGIRRPYGPQNDGLHLNLENCTIA